MKIRSFPMKALFQKKSWHMYRLCLVAGSFILPIQFLTAQSLQELLRLAENNNPRIQAYELRYSLAGEKILEANTLPDTEVSAGFFVSEPETRTGAQKARFSVRQMLPWFGTITAREHYAGAMAETEFVALSIERRQLALDVALAYYSLYTNGEQQGVIEENMTLLETYEQQALAAVEGGQASAVDVLRIQIRENELKERLAALKEEHKAKAAALNGLLNRDSHSEIKIVDKLWIPAEDPAAREEMVSVHPELLKYDKLYKSVEQSELINQKERAPNLGLGLDYVPVQERAGMSFGDNGKDIVMPMVSVSVPIFNSTYNSRSRQNTLRQQELMAQRKDRENMLRSKLESARAYRNAARIRYETQIENLEQARNAEQILIRNYETGAMDFDDVLDIQELQLKFQLNQIEALEDYFSGNALINYLVSA